MFGKSYIQKSITEDLNEKSDVQRTSLSGFYLLL